MGDVKVKEIKSANISVPSVGQIGEVGPIRSIKEVERISNIAPAAVHIKELNHIDPISVESLRIDEIRNLDPLQVDRLNVTHLPTVNLHMGRMPAMDVNMRQMPPLAMGLHQDFSLPSEYVVRAQFLGIEFMRFNIDGRTMLSPRDRVRREQWRSHDRSFAEVASVGNPAIPTQRIEQCTEAVMRPLPPPPVRHTPKPTCGAVTTVHHSAPGHNPKPVGPGCCGIHAGTPPFSFGLGPQPYRAASSGSSIKSGD